MTSTIRLLRTVRFVCLGAALTLVPLPPLVASQPVAEKPATQAVEAELEDAARVELTRALTLVREQQKQVCQLVVDKYPETKAAKTARVALRAFERYDVVDAERLAVRTHESNQVRAYWDARQLPTPLPKQPTVTITNADDVTMLYELKGPSMDWTAPLLLTGGETKPLHYTALLRQRSRRGVIVYQLEAGREYVFQTPPGEEWPQLYALPRADR